MTPPDSDPDIDTDNDIDDLLEDDDPERREIVTAVQESLDAHRDSTGHGHVDLVSVGHFPATLVISCTDCGQHLASVQKQL